MLIFLQEDFPVQDFVAADVNLSSNAMARDEPQEVEQEQSCTPVPSVDDHKHSSTTSGRQKRKASQALDEAISVAVQELKSFQQKPKPNARDLFGKFVIESLREMSADQEEFCTSLIFDCIKFGKRAALTAEHEVVANN